MVKKYLLFGLSLIYGMNLFSGDNVVVSGSVLTPDGQAYNIEIREIDCFIRDGKRFVSTETFFNKITTSIAQKQGNQFMPGSVFQVVLGGKSIKSNVNEELSVDSLKNFTDWGKILQVENQLNLQNNNIQNNNLQNNTQNTNFYWYIGGSGILILFGGSLSYYLIKKNKQKKSLQAF